MRGGRPELSPSLIVRMPVSVEVKKHWTGTTLIIPGTEQQVVGAFLIAVESPSGSFVREREGQGLCEGRGGRPELPVPNKLYGFSGRKEIERDCSGSNHLQIYGLSLRRSLATTQYTITEHRKHHLKRCEFSITGCLPFSTVSRDWWCCQGRQQLLAYVSVFLFTRGLLWALGLRPL